MKMNKDKTKEQLIGELAEMRQRVAELESFEAERKHTEESLRESEENYRDIVELAPDGIMTVDIKGVVTSCNTAFSRLTGFSKEEIVGKHFSKLPTANVKDIPQYFKVFASLLKGEISKPTEFVWKHKDGTQRLGEAHINSMKRGGKIIGLQTIVRDITERKQAEEALKEGEQRYIHAEKLGQFGHWRRNFKDEEAIWSAGAYSIFGVEPDRFKPIQENILNLVHPDDKEAVRRAREDASLRGEKFDIEYRIIRPNGEERVLHSVADVYTDINGKPKGLFGTVIDITERKSAEEEIQKFKTIADKAGYGVVIVNSEDEIVYVNDAYTMMSGYSQDELIGENVFILYPEEGMEKAKKLANRIEQESNVINIELCHKKKDGSVFPILIHSTVVKDENGKLMYREGTIIDITERKQAEEALLNFKTAADTAFYGTAIGTAEHLTYVNRSFAEMHGYSPDELIGQSYSILYTKEQLPVINKLREQLFSGGSFIAEEVWHKKKDGTSFPTLMTGHAIRDDEGNLSLIIGTTIDITERKRAEEALRESQALYRAIMELGGRVGEAIVLLQDDERGTGMHVYMNDVWCDITGYSREELRDISMADLIHPRDRDAAVARHVKRMRGESIPGLFELSIIKKNGTEVPVEITYAHSTYQGKFANVGFIREIAERKKTETALKQSEEFNSSVLRNSPNPILVANPDTSIQYVNPALEELTGYSLDELIGQKPPYPWWPEKDRLELMQALQEAIQHGRRSVERLFQKKNGDEFWVEVTATPVIIDGEFRHYIANWVDITERKKIEEALQLRAHLLNNANDSIIAADLEGNIIYANDTACRARGYTKEEMLEMHLRDTVNPEQLNLVPGRMQKVIEKGYFTFESEHQRRDGSVFPVEITAHTIKLWERTIILSAMRDITERKKMEEEIIRNRDYQERLNDSLTDIVFDIKFPERTIQYINKAVETVLGYRPEECMGQSIEMLYPSHEVFREVGRRLREGIERGDEITTSEHELKRKDGGIITVEGRTSYFRKDGKVVSALSVVRDITERKRAEQRIKDSEQRYISAEQIGNFGHFSRYLDTDRLVWSAGSYRIFGVDPNQWELTRENLYKMVHPQDLEKLRRANEEASRGAKGLDTEFRIIRPDGEERVVYSVADVTFDDAGKPERLFGTMQDVTERRKAEEEITRFKTIASVAPYGVGIADADGTMTYVNEALTLMHGYTPDEIVGQHYSILYTEEQLEAVEKLRKRCLKTGSFVGEEVWRKRKDGTVFPSSMSMHLVKDNKGKPLYFSSIMIDTTERKRAEAEYETIVRTAMDGFWLVDMRGHFLEVNDAYCHMIGYSRNELLNMSIPDIEATEKPDETAKHIQKIKEAGYDRFETRHRRNDGEIVDVEISVNYLPTEKGQMFVFIRDITERKKLEAEQQRSARLESIGTLAGGIAHDFNNILTGILGNISLAKRYVEPKSKADDRLLEAEKASLRARDLTQQLLTFSRGGTPVKTTVSIAELIPDSAGFALRGSNVSGQFSLQDDLWLVEVDEGQLNQVITNLIINACEAMPEGGVLNISAENLVIKKKGVLPLPRGNYVAIAIEDHGVGIPKEHLDRIFEPFFTTKQKGSGLGLATTYSIIRKHDGYITVESTPTVGTTFRIYLPASAKPAPEKEEAVVETPLRGGGKILVMDDEEMIRGMLNQMLPPAGYEVELTKDGAEAIERYRQAKESGHPFDAVIIDLTVPGGMGGRETIKKLLEIDAGVKAIVSSGYATDPVMANYKEYGFTDIVTKPYSVGDVEKILRSIINKERQVRGRKSK